MWPHFTAAATLWLHACPLSCPDACGRVIARLAARICTHGAVAVEALITPHLVIQLLAAGCHHVPLRSELARNLHAQTPNPPFRM